ncbi:MAG: 2-isopropylmalate synthase [Sulfuricurvum sp.]|uniref:2-isopropylmalate synthase n=1 Tax=Sulfuricurvum sp. TaxID=2025608 RepID=UPI00260A8844|nr:2-isopropylmalate synthase [Sulfuricurvum sp.]MDD2830419.1 2-isopropylmalate synthase [Sulfuricurvum sp.]MDD4950810.1 2-isopropylmalate synthase [Sulfuricurvum sp.]
MHTHTKYTPYPTVTLDKREWADKSATVAPCWVSTDLRDGNQALANPMGIEQKIAYFKALVEFGFKEIEVAYPSASQTEFDFCRRLIEEGLIPEDVTIGVLVPSIERHIIRSFEALNGAKRITMHLYNPTATNQRSVVFRRSREQIIALALEGVACIKREAKHFGGEVVFEYSPESFSQTELDFARDISNAVITAWEPTREHPMILNFPNTLEACSPNIYADRIEWMSKHIKNRESVIISVHPHNDRGCAVASAELAVLAGAQRVEGTILGNGERAGNVDLITLAFNYFSQGIDPCLRVDKVDAILERVTSITGMSVAERHPYVGSMIYTAFSGTHQDAIKKGMEHHREQNSPKWEVPYLAIDPRDIGREYKDSIRINSQSGKGGVAYVLKEIYGIEVPNDMQTKLADEVKRISQKRGGEISSDEVLGIYEGMMKRNENSWNAQEYNKHASFVSNLALPVVDLLAPIEGEEILDLGCGEGTLALEIQKSGAKVTGVDLSHEMVKNARAKGIDAMVMSATELEFKNRFDAIFSNAVLHWVKESETAVKNIHDALKPHGRFVAEFGGIGNCKTAVDAMKEVFKNHPEFGAFDDPWYFPSVEEYRTLLESCGFRVEYIELIPRPTPVDDIANWLDLFANGVTAHLSREEFNVFKEEVSRITKPKLYDENDGWHVDYVRLRVKAVRG